MANVRQPLPLRSSKRAVRPLAAGVVLTFSRPLAAVNLTFGTASSDAVTAGLSPAAVRAR